MTARSVRLATMVLATGALAACTWLPAALAEAQRAEGAFERTLTVGGPIALDISSGSGRIEVRAGQAGRVLVEGRIRVSEGRLFGGTTLSAEDRVRRIEANPPIQQSGGRIQIGRIDDEALRQNVSISYIVTVPADTSVVSRTGSGSQDVEGVHGPVEVTAGSGSIRVRDAGGDVRTSTGSGSITADTVGGSFEASTGSGSIDGSGVTGAVRVKTGSGSITVSQTGAGNVEASAGSGAIELSGVHGGVHASTASGGLTVRGEQTSDWELSASSGDVSIELSGKRAFDLDARSNSGRIDTAFPVTVQGGISRRELRGSVNGGGPRLSVHTSSGSIRIK